MARRQGAAGGRGAEEALSPLEVGVHDLSQAQAALAAATELGVAIQLRSAPDAAAYAGVGYLQALGAAAGHELLIDCGDDSGLVMAALRTGCRKVAFSGSGELAAKLADMAARHGATLRHETAPPDALLLPAGVDPGPALQARLARSAAPRGQR
jgi:hypothetical protein